MHTHKERFCKEDIVLKVNHRLQKGCTLESKEKDSFSYLNGKCSYTLKWEEDLFSSIEKKLSINDLLYTYSVKTPNSNFENFCILFSNNGEKFVLENRFFLEKSSDLTFKIWLYRYGLSEENLDTYYFPIYVNFSSLDIDKTWFQTLFSLLYFYVTKNALNRVKFLSSPVHVKLQPILKPFYANTIYPQ